MNKMLLFSLFLTDSDTDDDSRSSSSSLNRLGELKGGSRPLSVGSFRLPGMEPGFSEMVNRQAANGHISRGGARGLDVASNSEFTKDFCVLLVFSFRETANIELHVDSSVNRAPAHYS